MERLTKHYKDSDGYYKKCSEACHEKYCKRCALNGEPIYRLGQIEDILGDTYDLDRLEVMMTQCMSMREEVYERFRITGSIPVDMLRELVEADKVGRCVVLPCKYGERVYCVYHKREDHFGCAHCLAGYGMGVVCDYYNAETDTCSNSPEKYKNYEIISKHFEAGMIPNFGKTVFKSRKDAELACETLEKELYHE